MLQIKMKPEFLELLTVEMVKDILKVLGLDSMIKPDAIYEIQETDNPRAYYKEIKISDPNGRRVYHLTIYEDGGTEMTIFYTKTNERESMSMPYQLELINYYLTNNHAFFSTEKLWVKTILDENDV